MKRRKHRKTRVKEDRIARLMRLSEVSLPVIEGCKTFRSEIKLTLEFRCWLLMMMICYEVEQSAVAKECLLRTGLALCARIRAQYEGSVRDVDEFIAQRVVSELSAAKGWVSSVDPELFEYLLGGSFCRA